MTSNAPRVILIGRTNVGKSTLFNRMNEEKKVLVSPTSGTTRDLNEQIISWRDADFQLIDSGGLDIDKTDIIADKAIELAWRAIKKADLILFVIDGQVEIIEEDKNIVQEIKKIKKKTLLVINKIDNPSIRKNISPDFFKLGLGQPQIVSAISGIGVGDLLDEIISQLKKRGLQKSIIIEEPEIRLSIIGKTNVGKSSILNAILGQEKVIVTPVPHTTREPQDINIEFKKHNLLLVDTAGLRKKRKIPNRLEHQSAAQTRSVIEKSDVSLFVTDATEALTSQDQEIANLALKSQNGIIIIVNKWDLVKEKNPTTINKFIKYYQRFFPWLWWAPIIFVSALEKQRISKIFDLALRVHENRNRIIEDSILQDFAKRYLKLKIAKPSKGKKAGKIFKFHQTSSQPPSFSLVINRKERIHNSFLNLLEKKLRQEFDFSGTPINITLKENRK